MALYGVPEMTSKPPKESDTKPGKKTTNQFDVFISHASEDRDLARSFAKALSNRGVSCWFDEEKLEPGTNWVQKLREAIDHSRICLLLLSKESVSSKPWVSQEWPQILLSLWKRNNLGIFPLLLDRVEAPMFLQGWHSLRCDRQKPNVEKLVAEIKARLLEDQPGQGKESERDLTRAEKRFREIIEVLKQHERSDKVKNDKVLDE